MNNNQDTLGFPLSIILRDRGRFQKFNFLSTLRQKKHCYCDITLESTLNDVQTLDWVWKVIEQAQGCEIYVLIALSSFVVL